MTAPQETLEAALALLREGVSVRETARRVGVPRSTVADWRRLAEPAQTEPDTPGRRLQQGLEQAAKAAKDVADDDEGVREGADKAAGAPLPSGKSETEDEREPLDEPDRPPLLDRLAINAWHRYFNLLTADVPHHRAVQAVRNIDPDFEVSDEQAVRVYHAIGRTGKSVKFSDPSDELPPEVADVYDQYALGPDAALALAAILLDLAKEAYLTGLNTQLMAIGRGVVAAITDAGVLQLLTEKSSSIAQGVIAVYNRELAAKIYNAYLEQGSADSAVGQSTLADILAQWALGRADWKAEQVALTEASRFFNQGVLDFISQNRGVVDVAEVYVQPDECVCLACFMLVQGNPYQPDEAAMLGLPLHPGCCHDLELRSKLADAANPADVWAAQSDEAVLTGTAGS